MKKHKVLILSGGGYYGSIVATFLSFLGKGYDVAKNVDNISGTSIGGILTCALMSGCDVIDILNGFIEKGKDIFKRRNKLNILDIPWYSDEGLKKAIYDFVGDKTIGDTKKIYPETSMFVPSLNLTKGVMKVFDNIDGKDDDFTLVDVSLFTSSAMFYFPVRQLNNDCIVDGGVREVTCVITAATGLRSKLGIEYKDMDVFVIGAGESVNKKIGDYNEVNKWTALDWMTKFIINDITASNENTSKFWGQNLGFNSFEWFNPVRVYGSMDDVSQIDYILEECEMYKELFLDKWERFMK